jgi:uroporphyrin-III C-methyltransferase
MDDLFVQCKPVKVNLEGAVRRGRARQSEEVWATAPNGNKATGPNNPAARVFLVGAGPGDPGLITWRGLELVRSCDVLLYDRLVAPELLDEAPRGAERIYAGKTPGGRSADQSLINMLLIAYGSSGRRVVRLKGGDPFVFGRGGEEAQALAAADIPFEVVPGVTSAVAAPAYAGIPVTHRGIASSFAVITGRDAAEDEECDTRWRALASGPGTLVLLMGATSLRRTCDRLIRAGRDPDQPAAIIEWATTPRQRTITGSLGTIAGLGEASGIRPPATTVVGDVVSLGRTIAWFPPAARPTARHRTEAAPTEAAVTHAPHPATV